MGRLPTFNLHVSYPLITDYGISLKHICYQSSKDIGVRCESIQEIASVHGSLELLVF